MIGRALGRVDDPEIAGNGRDLGGVGEFLRIRSCRPSPRWRGVGADEYDAGLGERLSERRALGQKAVSGMDRLRARRLAGGDDLVDHEIGLRRGGRPDGDGLVRHLDMQGVLVGFRIDRDRLDPHAARRLDDSAGDFAAVGDQDFLEHRLPVGRKRVLLRLGPFYWNHAGS